MIRWKGKAVCRGIVCGPAAVLKRDERVKRQKTADPAAEISRLESALEEAKGQLEKLYKRTAAEVGEDSAAIFEVHRMMLEDEDYLDAVRSLIAGESVNAEYAVSVTGDNFSEMFAGMEDEYMKARAADVRDVSVRLVRCLRGEEEPDFSSLPPSVVFADDLTPERDGAAGQEPHSRVRDRARVRQFAHGHSGEDDEYPRRRRRTRRFREAEKRLPGRRGRLFRRSDRRPGRRDARRRGKTDGGGAGKRGAAAIAEGEGKHHKGRAQGRAFRQRRQRERRRIRAGKRRGRHRALSQRVSLSGQKRLSGRGGAVSGVQTGIADHGGQESGHSHAGHRRGPSRRRISGWRRRRIPRWVSGPSACALRVRKYSRRSFARCCAPRGTEISR